MNTFKRTALFVRESGKIVRLPYDLIDGDKFFVSQAPVNFNYNTTMLGDFDADAKEDPVVHIDYFSSEGDFTSKFDNVFYQYSTDDVSAETGYPRA